MGEGEHTMIGTTEINNFQSWKDVVIDFSRGVNVIKGRSHSGKSSIIRALRWGSLNDPNRGDYFASWFAGEKDITSVGIEYTDDSYIIRKKGKGVNSYDLSTGDLPTIGTDLPDEVKAITRMGPINIQDQDEQYFMLKETPGTVAKELNKLVGLDIIDETLTKMNRLENENKVKLKLLERDSTDIKEGLEELDFVDDLQKRVEHIEALWEEYQKINRQRLEIIRLTEEIRQEEEFIKDTSEWLTIKKPVVKLKVLLTQSAEIQRSLQNLNSLCDDISQAEVVKARLGERVGELKKQKEALLKEHANDFCATCGAYRTYWRKK
jgi:exonuclease SbcC